MWFLCSICHCSFIKRANLRRHIKSAHLNVRFICDIYNSEYKRKEYLTRHMSSSHLTLGESMKPSNQKACIPTTSHWDPTSDFNLDCFITSSVVESANSAPPDQGYVYTTDICKGKTASCQTGIKEKTPSETCSQTSTLQHFPSSTQGESCTGETYSDFYSYFSKPKDVGLLCDPTR